MSYRKLAALLAVLGLSIAGCITIGDEPATATPLDPVRMQAYLVRNLSHVSSITDALNKVVLAANGGNPSGVSYTQTATGIQGTVLIDVKGDGTDSAQVNATLTYNTPSLGMNGGAKVALTSITSPQLTGSANADLAVSGGGTTTTFSSGVASLRYTSGPTMAISSANLTVAPGAGSTPLTILGSADFHADNKSGTIFFESNGAGGWRMRVVSPDFATFTVP